MTTPPPPVEPADREALRVALQALDLAIDRLKLHSEEHERIKTYAAAVEAVWWVCAIDEQLNSGSAAADTPYARARDADANGASILGLRWLRDRHMHQVPITTALDDRTYHDPRPGAYNGFRSYSHADAWKPAAEIRSSAAHDAKPEGKRRRDAYESHVARHVCHEPLDRARHWLQDRVWQAR